MHRRLLENKIKGTTEYGDAIVIWFYLESRISIAFGVRIRFFLAVNYKSTSPSLHITFVAATPEFQPSTLLIAFHCATVPSNLILESLAQ